MDKANTVFMKCVDQVRQAFGRKLTQEAKHLQYMHEHQSLRRHPNQHWCACNDSVRKAPFVITVMEALHQHQHQHQVQLVCDQLMADPLMADGYSAVGISQGGLLIRWSCWWWRCWLWGGSWWRWWWQLIILIINVTLRGLVQRCPLPVKNLITFGSPHQVFSQTSSGIPTNLIRYTHTPHKVFSQTSSGILSEYYSVRVLLTNLTRHSHQCNVWNYIKTFSYPGCLWHPWLCPSNW